MLKFFTAISKHLDVFLTIPLIDGELCDISGPKAVIHHVSSGRVSLGLPCHLVHYEGGQLNANLIKSIFCLFVTFGSTFTSLFISLCSLFLLFSASLIS